MYLFSDSDIYVGTKILYLTEMLVFSPGQEDAERLLRNCKRYDLLNQFYQSAGQWGKV